MSGAGGASSPARPQLDLGAELVVDLFAGGGGASLGIEWGIGRPVDIAINHAPDAVAVHARNHPHTAHHCESVFAVDPGAATRRLPVGLLWASPDCKHFSRAKGRRPVSRRVRGLAWVVVRWARTVRPRVIMLENVEEFADWGPVGRDGMPCARRRGETFARFLAALERQGYRVEYRTLRACDYGAPTIRRRLFLIARRDGLPIVWPRPTHGAPDSLPVRNGRLAPWRTAAECIDWSLPCPSIFTRARPLAPNTLRRIARGVQRFVIEAARPFIVPVTRMGDARVHGLDEPMRTVTTATRGEFSVVAAFLAKHYGGVVGQRADAPAGTVTTVDHHALVAAHMINLKGSDRRARAASEPAATVCAGGTHAGLVAALMAPYYGSGSGLDGRDLRDPAPTVTTRDRLQLITVRIDGADYVLTDIGMRMLAPRELFRAQGFPDSYRIDTGAGGRALPKSVQVALCGNSVPPQLSAALVRANFAHERAWMAA